MVPSGSPFADSAGSAFLGAMMAVLTVLAGIARIVAVAGGKGSIGCDPNQ